MPTDAEKIAARLQENAPPLPSDIEKRLNAMKKDIETNGVATLFLQRGPRGEIVAFTVLDSTTIDEVRPEVGDPYFVQNVDGKPVAKLTSTEVLVIDVREKEEPEVTASTEAAKPPKPKK